MMLSYPPSVILWSVDLTYMYRCHIGYSCHTLRFIYTLIEFFIDMGGGGGGSNMGSLGGMSGGMSGGMGGLGGGKSYSTYTVLTILYMI